MFTPIKELGQNFLSDASIVSRMVEALDIKEGDEIIEIGPGHGILTECLAEEARRLNASLYAVEIDKRFYEKLENMFVQDENVHIIKDNVLDYLPKYQNFHGRPVKVIGSLPYYITSPIVHQVVKMDPQPLQCVFLIQKEVAQKITAQVPDTSYMSAFVQTFYETQYLFTVPKDKFHPVPQVDGGVFKMIKRTGTIQGLEDVIKYEGFLHRGFSSPRKMLNKPFSKEELEKAGFAPNLRPQNLSASDWEHFYQTLKK